MISEKNIRDQLRACIPLNTLSPENFTHLCNELNIEEIPAGKKIFNIGDDDTFSVYLIAGGLELSASDGIKNIIQAGQDTTRYALANLKPRRYNGIARTPVKIVRIDSHLLDKLMVIESVSLENTGGLVVDELDADSSGDNTWLMKLLQKKIFLDLPAAHLQEVLNRMQEIAVHSGEIIIKQGDPGDYYYVICEGRCRVTRKILPTDRHSLVLAELVTGDGFGEEALVSKNPRNATITMVTDGRLMRLSSKDFAELLEHPVLRWLSPKEASQAAKRGAILLDVRTEQEYTNSKIRGSMNIPLQELREGTAKLKPNSQYICYCDTGERSSAAAFLLRERGYDASVMRGGLALLNDLFAAKAQKTNPG